jgi:glycosyltransferase involved in cell wall biosynthesis
MRIAVNTRFLLPGLVEGYENYFQEVFIRITRKNPGHQFFFIYESKRPTRENWPSNVEHIVCGPKGNHPFLLQCWYNYYLPSRLKKIKAEILFSPGGAAARTPIPQCIAMTDLTGLDMMKVLRTPPLKFFEKNVQRFIERANHVISFSELSKNNLVEKYNVAKKISVVYNGVNEGQMLTHEQKQGIKNKYTEGKEYFLYGGLIHSGKNLVNLLKAFSIFKKRQQSGMKLMLASKETIGDGKFVEDLKSYKYREDVVVTADLSFTEYASIMEAAYAFVYPCLEQGYTMQVFDAIVANVPVIISMKTSMQEITGEAALLVDGLDPVSISEKMMLIYKDEKGRQDLIEKGQQLHKHFSWDKTADETWRILNACLTFAL